MPRPKPPPEKQDAVREAVEHGRSLRDVAKEFGVSPETIRNWTRERERALASVGPKRPGGRFAGIQPMRFENEQAPPAPALEGPSNPHIERMRERVAAQLEQSDEQEEGTREDIDATADTLTVARDLMRRMLEAAANARKFKNSRDEQRALTEAGKCALLISQIEKRKEKDGDVIEISRKEFDQINAEIEGKLAAHIAERPLLCADCGRALAIKWGTETFDQAAE